MKKDYVRRFDTNGGQLIIQSLMQIYKNSHFIQVGKVSMNISVATKMILSESISSFPFDAHKRRLISRKNDGDCDCLLQLRRDIAQIRRSYIA